MTTAPTNPGFAGSRNIFIQQSNNASVAANKTYAAPNTTYTYSLPARSKRGNPIRHLSRDISRRSGASDACNFDEAITVSNYCNTTVSSLSTLNQACGNHS